MFSSGVLLLPQCWCSQRHPCQGESNSTTSLSLSLVPPDKGIAHCITFFFPSKKRMFSFIYPLKAFRHASKKGLCWNWLCLQISIWFVSVRITEVALLVPPNMHFLLMLYNSVCIQVGCKCEAHLEHAHNRGNVFLFYYLLFLLFRDCRVSICTSI